ncbi:MAG: DNA-binding response regulator [Dehalococcoidia bacterium]|nr:MAG: DNA-binding response regulator [Dehalococcoidia bacterium]
MTTILLVEDARDLARIVARELAAAGYRVVQAADGRTALAVAARERPDLVILDWMLPELDGLEVLRELRRSTATPVLMLTARGEEADRVIGLELGADDYLPKPFGMRELLARVRALLRRDQLLRRTLAVDRADRERPVRWGAFALDPAEHRATLDGEPLDLSPTEFALLHLLLRNPGRAFSRAYLIEQVWDQESVSGDRAVDNTVLRLRKKLGDYGDAIETVWGVGYRLRRDPP